MCALYAFPLIAFIYCYGAIYLEIYRKNQRVLKDVIAERFRRSNDDVLSRAKKRTLKMTISIVIVFIICWTPYYFICMWYSWDKSSVGKVNSLVRKALFIFASTNSCMNPLVYGLYNIRGRMNNNNNVVRSLGVYEELFSLSTQLSLFLLPQSVNNRHTSLTNRLDSSNQLLQKPISSLPNGNGVAAAVVASTKLAHVVRLKTNGTSSVDGGGGGDIQSPELIAPSAPLPDSEIDANDDVSVSVVTIRCGPEQTQPTKQMQTQNSKVSPRRPKTPPAIYPK